MTAISKNVYIDKLNDILKEYNNTSHRTIKMKPIDVKDNKYIDVKKEINDKDLKFKIGDHVRISKCKNIFISLLRKLKILCHMHILLMILMVKKLLAHFMKMN